MRSVIAWNVAKRRIHVILYSDVQYAWVLIAELAWCYPSVAQKFWGDFYISGKFVIFSGDLPMEAEIPSETLRSCLTRVSPQ